MEFGNGDISNFKPVNDGNDSRIGAVLLWAYNFFVHRVLTDAIIVDEELAFLVKDAKMIREPEWSASIQCFSILDQDHMVITFKVCHQLG